VFAVRASAVIVAALLTSMAGLASAPPANVAGAWQFTVELEVATARPVVTFTQEGEKLTGTYEGRYGKSNLEGTVKENQLQFTVTMVAEGTTITGLFTGVYENDRLSGDVDYEAAGEGKWAAVRIPVRK
jgi:hypothetical protein